VGQGQISVAVYRAKAGHERALLRVIEDRLPLLRRLGLATDREHVLMRAGDGAIIEVSEWSSEDAIARAHEAPEVLALWARFDAVCDFVELNRLAECAGLFATFEALE
jgi:hypothetical protein